LHDSFHDSLSAGVEPRGQEQKPVSVELLQALNGWREKTYSELKNLGGTVVPTTN